MRGRREDPPGCHFSICGQRPRFAKGRLKELSNTTRKNPLLRRLQAVLVAGVLVAVCAVCVPVAGCGSENADVQNCTREANEILSGVTEGLAAVRESLSLPLAGSGGMKDALASYRKVLSENQDRLDRMHAPEPCIELTRMLRVVIDKGRDVANVSTQFADYFGQAAPVAKQAAELVETISSLKPEARTRFGLVGLQDQAAGLLASFQSVISSATFQDIQRVLGEFLQDMNDDLEKASKVASSELPEQAEEGATPESEDRSTPADEYLDDIPVKWEEANGEIAETLAQLMQSTGYNDANAQFDAAVLGTLAAIQELEKKYGVAPLKKK